jgi:hypothetical protein
MGICCVQRQLVSDEEVLYVVQWDVYIRKWMWWCRAKDEQKIHLAHPSSDDRPHLAGLPWNCPVASMGQILRWAGGR